MKLPRPRYSLATLLGLVAVCAVLSWGVPTLWHYWTVGRHVEVFKDSTQDDKVRHEAEEALVKVGSPAVLDLVRLIKEEKTDTVRGQAAFTLSQIRPTALEPVIPDIIAFLKDKDPMIRVCAVVALGELGPKAKMAVPALIENLKDQDDGVRIRAALTFRRVDGVHTATCVGVLLQIAKDGVMHSRRFATQALGQMGPDAVPALLEVLKHKPTWEQFTSDDAILWELAAKTLGDMGPAASAAAPALIEILKDEDELYAVYVRDPVERALKQISPETVATDLR